ncbi:hypothetical protein ACIBQ0_00270 [Nocardia nova]|uniref:hypothetical protein n=1 Tax=Nocardia nova TaxID=37330 RepID=UPI00379FD9C3
MGYSFRIWIKVSSAACLDIDNPRHVLTPEGTQPRVTLATRTAEQKISEADTFFLTGGSYPSLADAEAGAVQWRKVVQGVFTNLRIGADLGDPVPRQPTCNPIHDMMTKEFGTPFFEGHHGVLVFDDDPFPTFMNAEASIVRSMSADQFTTALTSALAVSHTAPSSAEEAAYDLFAASFFESNPEARIVLLTSAVEAFHGVRMTRRITQTLVNFVSTELPNKQYGGMSSGDFFRHCYVIRGDITHGAAQRLDRKRVGSAAAKLELLVADLLAKSFPG